MVYRLKFVDNKYSRYEKEIKSEFKKLENTRLHQPIEEIAMAKCGFYLPPKARYKHLLDLPNSKNIAMVVGKGERRNFTSYV